ncbi:TIGR03032 family protein [Sphingomonas desiccabilis]|uniref:TIGR03032 family protein n=1 Tax=Sphingomonas desiccabilis TaxID=429134 RepID=UPI00185BD674|nr:TIGR03032 family protein [Sphingomonas desiccabilis]MBB3912585.1 hypothetical protein [Sphingomonas desiccabilis]
MAAAPSCQLCLHLLPNGQLFLVGLLANGTFSFNQQNFARAMGLCYQPGRLYLGALSQF